MGVIFGFRFPTGSAVKRVQFLLFYFPVFLCSLRPAGAEEKQLGVFEVTGTDQTSVALTVPKDATEEQLGDLVSAISCARRNGRLGDLSIPPTTPQGRKGPNAIMQVYIFNDASWATGEKIKKWLDSDDGSSFSTQFGQKVQAYYYYSVLGDQEQLSIGFASGGRPFSRSYKLLAPLSAQHCASTSYIPAWNNHPDELKTFLDSAFAKNFRIHESSKWTLRSGGQNVSFKSENTPSLSLSVEQSQRAIRSVSAIFYVGYDLGDPEFKLIKELTEAFIPQDLVDKVLTFARSNINKKFKEKLSPGNPPGLSMDSYYTMKLKGFTIRAGKHGQEPTFIIEKQAKR
jgi:hypothetical protein